MNIVRIVNSHIIPIKTKTVFFSFEPPDVRIACLDIEHLIPKTALISLFCREVSFVINVLNAKTCTTAHTVSGVKIHKTCTSAMIVKTVIIALDVQIYETKSFVGEINN